MLPCALFALLTLATLNAFYLGILAHYINQPDSPHVQLQFIEAHIHKGICGRMLGQGPQRGQQWAGASLFYFQLK